MTEKPVVVDGGSKMGTMATDKSSAATTGDRSTENDAKKRHVEEHPDFGSMGIFAGYGEFDHEPRCDCGHLFEICSHPQCPTGADYIEANL